MSPGNNERDLGTNVSRPFALHMAILVASAVLWTCVLWSFFDLVPDPMPVHWDASGDVDRTEPKTFLGAMTPIIVLSLLMPALSAMMWAGARFIPYATPAMRDYSHMVLRETSLLTTLLTVILSGWIVLALLQVVRLNLFLLAVIAVLLVAWGWRISKNARDLSHHYPHDDYLRHLKLGMFYYNPSDPRTMLRLSSASSAINFARPQAWALVAALIFSGILITLLTIVAG